MSLKRLTSAMAASAGLGLLLCGSVLADGQGPQPERDADERPEVVQPPPGPSPTDTPGGPPSLRPGPGYGPARQGDLRPRRPRQPLAPDPRLGGSANRPGRPGPPDQRGPFRPGHPGGPPRWPYYDWDALQKGDPERYKLLKADHDMERQARELAIQHQRAPLAQRPALRKQLQELVNQHFEVRQQRRRLELKRLEEELKRLRDAIELRNQTREKLVEKRTSQLLGEDEVDF